MDFRNLGIYYYNVVNNQIGEYNGDYGLNIKVLQ